MRRTCRLIRGCGYAVPTPVRCCPPEEKIQKDDYLRPPRLRRSSGLRNMLSPPASIRSPELSYPAQVKSLSSGQLSLSGVGVSGSGLPQPFESSRPFLNKKYHSKKEWHYITRWRSPREKASAFR